MELVKWFFVILRTGSRIKSGMTEGGVDCVNDRKVLISFRPIGGSGFRNAKTFLMFFPF